jgi:hypothetical protein
MTIYSDHVVIDPGLVAILALTGLAAFVCWVMYCLFKEM